MNVLFTLFTLWYRKLCRSARFPHPVTRRRACENSRTEGLQIFPAGHASRSFKQSFDATSLACLFTSKVGRKNVWSIIIVHNVTVIITIIIMIIIIISLSKSWECEVGRLNNKPSQVLHGFSGLAHTLEVLYMAKMVNGPKSERAKVRVPVQSSAPPCIQSNLAWDRASFL